MMKKTNSHSMRSTNCRIMALMAETSSSSRRLECALSWVASWCKLDQNLFVHSNINFIFQNEEGDAQHQGYHGCQGGEDIRSCSKDRIHELPDRLRYLAEEEEDQEDLNWVAFV